MTIELLIAYRHNSFVFPKMKNKNNEALRSQSLVVFVRKYVIMKLPLLAAGRCATNAGGFLLTGT